LPDKTLAAPFENSADGRKLSKERVTINACANATGTINRFRLSEKQSTQGVLEV